MELTAIYHRPESEYAYLYKDDQLHIRIRTKKEDIKRIVLHYGDPFIFIEDLYEATKEMDKVTTDDLFDYWQVSVSVRHARIQYLFELEDTAGEKVLYGDRGVAAYTEENLDFVMNGFKLPFIHEIDGCAVPDWVAQTVWYQIFLSALLMGIQPFLQKVSVLGMRLLRLPCWISLVEICRESSITWTTCRI